MRKFRKSIAILIAVAMVFCMAPAMVFAADADSVDKVVRIEGADRYATSAETAVKGVGSAGTVIIARGEKTGGFADGLAASYLARVKGAPILLTEKGALSSDVAGAINKLGASNAIILGGTGVVSEAVADALKIDATRIFGDDRYETAYKVAKEGGNVDTALVVSGNAPADALVAGPVAYANSFPVLLVDNTTGDTTYAKKAIAELGIKNLYVIGGTGVVSEAIYSELDGEVDSIKRLGGEGRVETSLAVAAEFFADAANYSVVGYSGLADAVGAAVFGNPILYADFSQGIAGIKGYLADKVASATLFGGTGVVSGVVEGALEDLIEGEDEVEGLVVESVSAIDEMTLEVVLSDETTHTVELETALEANVETEVTFEIDGKEYTATVTWEQEIEEELTVESVSAINAKTLKVEFNNAVAKEDQAKATFDVKRGTIATAVEATWAEDGKSVELARATNLLAGTYTVTVGGLEFAEGANVGTVEVEAQKIASLEIATENVTIGNPVDLVYNAKDQYGEKMDVTADKIAWTVVNTTDINNAVVAGVGTPATDKVIKLDTTAANVDDVLRVTAFLTADPTIKVVKEVTVSNVFTQEFALGTVVLPEGKTRLDQAVSAYDVELSYTAADNYGEAVKLLASQTGATIGEITFVSSNEDLVKVANMATDAKSKLTFKVEAAKSGKATLTALNNSTGETSSVEIEVFATAAPATAEFGEFKDGAEIVAGDAAGTAKLGITFFDQYGEAIEDDTYTIGTDFNVTVTGAGTLTVTPALVGGYMVFDDLNATAGTYTITLVHKTTGASASTQVTVNEARVPNELKVKTAPDASVEALGTTDVTFEVYDQYGKLIPFGSLTPYTIDVTYSNAGTTASVANVKLTSYTETITGNVAGTETITFTLNSAAPVTAIDAQEFEIEVIDALVTLDVTVDKTEYTAGETATVTIKAEKAGNVAHTDFNKTAVVEVSVGSNNTYLRTVEFVNGVATTTVPVEEAGATEAINATLDTKTDASAPTVKVVAAEASELGLSTNSVIVVDEFGNKADYDFTGIAKVTNVAGTLTNITPDAEGNVQVKIVDGDVKNTSDIAVTYAKGSEASTLTLTLSNGDVFSVTVK